MKDNRDPLFEILFDLDKVQGQIDKIKDKVTKKIIAQSNSVPDVYHFENEKNKEE